MLIDSSAKWNSSIAMLERDFTLKDAYLELFGKKPLSELNGTDAHYVISRNLAGVLRPFELASGMLQADSASVATTLPDPGSPP